MREGQSQFQQVRPLPPRGNAKNLIRYRGLTPDNKSSGYHSKALRLTWSASGALHP